MTATRRPAESTTAARAWAEERAREAGAGIRFHRGDAFSLVAAGDLRGPYDLIYDSGCFHHLPPHRRISYLDLLDRALAPGGHLGLACFASGATGSELTDAAFYRGTGLQGGLAYTPEPLRRIFTDLTEVELRRMAAEPHESARFGQAFLWTALFRRPGGTGGQDGGAAGDAGRAAGGGGDRASDNSGDNGDNTAR